MTLAGVSLRVEIAFAALPFDTSPTWTDITGWVKSVATKRGRSNEVGTVEAGTAAVQLDNSDGRFTPQRATSPAPYLNNIAPRRQVRIYATVGAAVKPIFRGYTEKWQLTHPGGGAYSEAQLDCVDALKVLGDAKLLDFYGEWVRRTRPAVYYPLTEPGGSIYFADRSGHGAPSGLLYHRSWNDAKSQAGSDGLLANSSGTSVAFDPDAESVGADIDLTGALDHVRFVPGGWSMVAWLKLGADFYTPAPADPAPSPTNPEPPPYDPTDPGAPEYPPADPSPLGPGSTGGGPGLSGGGGGMPGDPGSSDAPTPDSTAPGSGPTVPGPPRNVVVTPTWPS